MPQIPYALSGIVYDTDGSTPVNGATITAYDREAGDSTSGETNSSGAYSLDMANMVQDYSSGDNIIVEAVSGNKIKQYKTTILGEGFEEHNFTLEYTDALGAVIDLLNNNWQKERTDNILPTIDRSFHHKELKLENNDYVLLYEIIEPIRPFALGGTSFEEITGVSLDVSTTKKVTTISGVRPHLMKMREEVKRILKSKIGSPGLPFQLIVPLRVKDLSNKAVGMGRFVADYNLSYWGSS